MATQKPESPIGLLIIGALLGLFGGFVVDADIPAWIAFAALWLGGILVLIGAVGVGVTMGSARADWERQRR